MSFRLMCGFGLTIQYRLSEVVHGLPAGPEDQPAPQTVNNFAAAAEPTGEWLRKLDNRYITQTIHKLKGQWVLDASAVLALQPRPTGSNDSRNQNSDFCCISMAYVSCFSGGFFILSFHLPTHHRGISANTPQPRYSRV